MANSCLNILMLFILIPTIVAGDLVDSAPEAATDGKPSEPPLVLLRLQSLVQEELDLLDENVSIAAEELALTGLVGPEARNILNAVSSKNPSVITCSAVDLSGIMVTVEPDAYRWAEGSNISDQKHVIEIQEAHRPVLSATFSAVEGFDAVVLEWPIFSPDGEMIGSINALFRPDLLLNSTAELWRQEIGDENVTAWAMATDGLILYDPDPEEVGRNLFTDPLYEPYAQLLALGERIASEEEGTGTYEFLGPCLVDPVVKSASWATAGLHGTKWRVVVVRV